MMKLDELIQEVEQLPAEAKWQLVKQLLHSLEAAQQVKSVSPDWHTFLRATYGILADDPIERPPQLSLE